MASSSAEVEIMRLKDDDEEGYEGSDRLSDLPETLLCSQILTRLPITDAVRSSLLSPKWRHLWTKIPHLHFSPPFFYHLISTQQPRTEIFMTYGDRMKHLSRCIKDTVVYILRQHQAPLEGFQFHLNLPGVEAMDINQCIQYAAIKGVKWMSLQDDTPFPPLQMHLPFSFFACTALVELKLKGLMFPEIPSCSENLLLLKSCWLWDVGNLTDHMLQRLLVLCPNLEILAVRNCKELIHLKIQAPNLNSLMLVGCPCLESLTADCPQLIQIRIWRRGSILAKLQLNSYSLVELNSTSRIMGIASCEMEMGMVSDFTFPNLKNAYLGISSNLSEGELGVLSFLLKNAPSLITVTLALPKYPEYNLMDEKQKIMDQILYLKRAYTEVEIKILKDERYYAYDKEMYEDEEEDYGFVDYEVFEDYDLASD